MLTVEISVLYEDNHILIVDKPAGIPTQDDPFAETSMETLAKEWIKEKYKKPGNVFLQPIHRLDKPVSGIVIFAKTSKALSRLNVLMRNQAIHKTYEAITEGYPPASAARLEHYLVHDDHFARVTGPNEEGTKLAILNYRVLSKKEGRAHVSIELLTGRYHQIRAQLAAIGCPVLGDRRYGSMDFFSKEGIALQHVHARFVHPITHEEINIELPASWA